MLIMLKKLWLGILSCLILTACTHKPLIFVEPFQKQDACFDLCISQLQYCKKVCKDSCPECCGMSKFHATESYHRYVKQSHVQGFFPINLLQYYDDPLKCKKNSCDCQADYVLCKQQCTGIITKKLNHKKEC